MLSIAAGMGAGPAGEELLGIQLFEPTEDYYLEMLVEGSPTGARIIYHHSAALKKMRIDDWQQYPERRPRIAIEVPGPHVKSYYIDDYGNDRSFKISVSTPPRYTEMKFARDPNRYIQTGETQTILGTVCYVWRMVAKDLERLNSSRREKCLTDTGIPLVHIIDMSFRRRAVVLKRERQDPAFFEIPPDAQPGK